MEPSKSQSPSEELLTCGRCGASYPPKDRRAQLSGPALCRSCHLDPELRRLAIAIPEPGIQGGAVKRFSRWLGRSASTLSTILTRPAGCYRAVEEPVQLGPWVAFLLTVAAPSWLALVLVTAWVLLKAPGPRQTFADPRWLDLSMGSAAVDALDLWTLAMFPLGLLAAFFCGGTLAHLLVLLTGPSSRTLGASLRAMAISLVPLLVIDLPFEVAFRAGWISLDLWVLGGAVAGFWSLALLALGLSRSHHTALIRGWVAAPLAWLMIQLLVLLRVAFAIKEAPIPGL